MSPLLAGPIGQSLTRNVLDPIPWRYADAGLLRVWDWTTAHISARITAASLSDDPVDDQFSWELHAAGGGTMQQGIDGSFADAEAAIREHVGKALPVDAGYGRFAGALATTFLAATSDTIDFGPYLGRDVVLDIRRPNGSETTFAGELGVHHYLLRLTSAGRTFAVNPAHVLAVHCDAHIDLPDPNMRAAGRVIRGDIRPGCTGRPGFLPNTIDHTGPVCPTCEEL